MAYDYLTSNGTIVPDTSTLKSDVQGEYISAFGPSLVLADETPQGRLIDVETLARENMIGMAAEVANQINPTLASGVFLESICSLHGIIPTPNTFSTMIGAQFSGVAGTVIPSGSRVSTSDGDLFSVVSNTTLDLTGNALGDLQAVATGAIPATAGATLSIIDGILGWTGIAAPSLQSNITLGTATETDQQLRILRLEKLSYLGKGTVDAISSNVKALNNVHSIAIRENVEASDQVIDGVTMTPHSTWVCVEGGVDTEICLALLNSKQTGSPWTVGLGNGTPISLVIIEPISGQSYPVSFVRPFDVPIKVRVTCSISSNSSLNPQIVIPTAILDYANGNLEGESGFICGVDVSPFELAGAISIETPGIFIRKVEICTVASGVFSTDDIIIELWEIASVQSGEIEVVII